MSHARLRPRVYNVGRPSRFRAARKTAASHDRAAYGLGMGELFPRVIPMLQRPANQTPLADLPLRLPKVKALVRGVVARQGYAYLKGGDNPFAGEEVVPH